jgi:hypothetical protein
MVAQYQLFSGMLPSTIMITMVDEGKSAPTSKSEITHNADLQDSDEESDGARQVDSEHLVRVASSRSIGVMKKRGQVMDCRGNFILSHLLFCAFDCVMHRHESSVVEASKKSHASHCSYSRSRRSSRQILRDIRKEKDEQD